MGYVWPLWYYGAVIADPPIRIVRSDRRRRTISAWLVENGTVLEVLAPLAATHAELVRDPEPEVARVAPG